MRLYKLNKALDGLTTAVRLLVGRPLDGLLATLIWTSQSTVAAEPSLDIQTSQCFYHYHLENKYSQSIKPTVVRLTYIPHDTSISCDPHLLTP